MFVDVVKYRQFQVCLVHHPVFSLNYLFEIQHIAIASHNLGNMDATPQVEDGVHLDRSSVILAVCPHHQLDATRNHGRVENKNLTTWKVYIENELSDIKQSDHTYLHNPKLFTDVAVAIEVLLKATRHLPFVKAPTSTVSSSQS